MPTTIRRNLWTPPEPAGDVVGLDEFATVAAALVDTIERDDGFAALQRFLGRFCAFENCLVYMFSGNSLPVLLGTSVPEQRLTGQMADFVAGLFLLDPFVQAGQRGMTGLVRLRDIMPDDFLRSEFFQQHYRYTDVCDEVRFLVPVDHGRSIHVFIERETPSPSFSDDELAKLISLTPLVSSYLQGRYRWLLRRQTGDKQHPLHAIDLTARIGAMSPGLLTPRECEVVECMLKGHSARSIGKLLQIEEGTVTNHKRNIYSKLEVHSMAQLFNLFLRSLTSP